MSGEFGYALAFTTGLLGATHCLGMCGGLAAGYFAGHGWRRKLLPQLAYHGMRIAVYVLLGTLGAVLGRTLVQSGVVGKGQGLLMILAGIAVMAIGLGLAGLLPWWRRKPCPGPDSNQACRTIRFEEQPRAGRRLPLLAGTLNGLMPCSLVFSVALKATAAADPLHAGLLMLCFGLGTLPTMALVTTLGGAAGAFSKGAVEKLTGAVVVLMGAWTLYEGVVFYDIMRGLASW